MTGEKGAIDVPAPAMAGADSAHGSKRRRKRPPCAIPGCTARPRYVCAHYESRLNDPSQERGAASAAATAAGHHLHRAGENGGDNNDDDLLWFCKAHKCRLCVPVDGAGAAPRQAENGGAQAVDVARIADMARAALVRIWQDNGAAGDPYIPYCLQTILELCGPDYGEVRVCVCGCPLSSHYVGFGRCMDCPDDSSCPAMRRRDGQDQADGRASASAEATEG